MMGQILKELKRFVWKKLLQSKAFHRCTLNFPKVQTDVQTYSLMLGSSNFAILAFSICSFHFWHSLLQGCQSKPATGTFHRLF